MEQRTLNTFESAPGDQFRVMISNQEVMVTCPPNVRPNQRATSRLPQQPERPQQQLAAVSLWSNFTNGEYNDTKLYETDHIIIVHYCGQRNGTNDRYIGQGNHFFTRINKKYKFLGKVIYCKNIGIQKQFHKNVEKNVNIFELVIRKEPEMLFRIKHDAYSYFGWKRVGQQHMSGIIKHTLL